MEYIHIYNAVVWSLVITGWLIGVSKQDYKPLAKSVFERCRRQNGDGELKRMRLP